MTNLIEKILSEDVSSKDLNAKALDDFQRSLSGLSTTEAIHASVKQLATLRENQTLRFEDQLQFVYSIDQISQQKIRASIAKRLAIHSTNRAKAVAIDAVVCPFYQYLFSEYLRLTDILLTQKFVDVAKPEDRALFVCRAIHAGLNYIKWHHFDDQPAPQDIWKTIKKLFKISEWLNVSMLRVFMYPQQSWITDSSSLIAGGAMFSLLHKENYTAIEIEVASQYLLEYGHSFHFSKQFESTQHHYFIDLDQDGAAQRIRNMTPQTDYRYWSTTSIVNAMAEATKKIADRTLPNNSPIRNLSSLRVLVRLFEKLQKEWSPTHYVRQRRVTERFKVDKYIKVDLGFNAILQTLRQASPVEKNATNGASTMLDEMMLDFDYQVLEQVFDKQEQPMRRQTWRVIDESRQGFGVDLGFSPSQEVDTGYILGFETPDQQAQYLIAEVKSLKKQKNSAFRAGLEVISQFAMGVVLEKCEGQESHSLEELDLIGAQGDDPTVVEAVWVPADNARKLSSSVILPLRAFKQKRSFKMRVRNQEKVLVLGPVIAFQHDWVRATIASIR